jgi:hypothetical protein
MLIHICHAESGALVRKGVRRMTDRKYRKGLLLIMAIGIGAFVAVPGLAESKKNTVSHLVRLVVAETAVLDIDDSSPLDLVLVTFASKNALPAGTDTGTRTLHYTTINKEGITRRIYVSNNSSNVAPSGTSLKIAVKSIPVGCGTPSAEVTVDANPKCIISDIPSCATYSGSQGAVLQYRFVINEESSIIAGSRSEITILYTIMES